MVRPMLEPVVLVYNSAYDRTCQIAKAATPIEMMEVQTVMTPHGFSANAERHRGDAVCRSRLAFAVNPTLSPYRRCDALVEDAESCSRGCLTDEAVAAAAVLQTSHFPSKSG